MRHWTPVFLLLGLLMAGCQQTPAKNADVDSLSQGTGVAALTDPCAGRLQDIEDAMLLYYTVNRKLPPNLESLQTGGNLTHPLEIVCPVSHLPYVYTGVNLAGGNPEARLLLVYDPTPVHAGKRWAIVAAPANPGQTLTMWVAPLDEKTFKYLQSVTDAHAAILRPAP